MKIDMPPVLEIEKPESKLEAKNPLLLLSEKLPTDLYQKLLEKYELFTKQVNNIEEFVKNNFSENYSKDAVLIEKIRNNLFRRADFKLLDFYNSENSKPEDFLSDIDNLQEEKEIFFSVLKLIKEQNSNLQLEDISSLNLERLEPDQFFLAELWLKENQKSRFLSNEQIKRYERLLKDKDQMEEIYKDNYQEHKEIQKHLVEDFNKYMGISTEYLNDNHTNIMGTEIYTLRYKEDIIAFNRFDVVLPSYDTVSFKFFNVDKDIQGSGIGQMMIKATLDKKAKNKTIIADCISSKPVSSFYIENGFVARKSSQGYNESLLSITRDDKFIPKEFKTKIMDKEDLINENNLPEGTIVRKYKIQKDCDFSYIKQEESEKYTLTRYFFDKNSKEWITVFEPVKVDLNLHL